jgi:hypothetical protein
MLAATFEHLRFTDADVVNPEDFLPGGASPPHQVCGFLLHDHGFALAVVFADRLQDALDLAADAGKLDCFRVTEKERADDPDDERLSFLGNACEPFDIESLGAVILPNPRFSFVALFNAMTQ